MIIDVLTVEEQTELLKELTRAVLSGAMEVNFADRSIKYRSLKDMKQTIQDLQVALSPTSKKKTRVKLNYSKGL